MNVVDSHDVFPLTISEIMYKALSDRVFPGGVVAFGTKSSPCIAKAYGMYTYHSSRQVTEDSIWDVASLTKILVTTPSIMILYECGMIDLDDRVCRHIPEFQQNGKGGVTVRQLLTHTSGLREFYHFYDLGLRTKQQVLDFIYADKLWYYPGQCKYSDLSMLVLGALVERITGFRLDVFANKHIFQPLRMVDTGFRCLADMVFNDRVVPTEIDKSFRKRLLWGEVHDPNAYAMGGVAGHAGVFSTGRDIGKFAAMLLNGGRDPATGVRIFRESTLRLFTRPQKRTRRNPRPFALGWDTSSRRSENGYTSAGSKMGPRTFGHTGFTGASLWVDPDHDVFVALLTNAVHPFADVESAEFIRQVRPAIADAVMEVAETMVEKSMDVDLLARVTPPRASADARPRGGHRARAAADASSVGDTSAEDQRSGAAAEARRGHVGATGGNGVMAVPVHVSQPVLSPDKAAAAAAVAPPGGGQGIGDRLVPPSSGVAPTSPRSPREAPHAALQQASDEDITVLAVGQGGADASSSMAAISATREAAPGAGDHAALFARVGEDRLAAGTLAGGGGSRAGEPGAVTAAAAAAAAVMPGLRLGLVGRLLAMPAFASRSSPGTGKGGRRVADGSNGGGSRSTKVVDGGGGVRAAAEGGNDKAGESGGGQSGEVGIDKGGSRHSGYSDRVDRHSDRADRPKPAVPVPLSPRSTHGKQAPHQPHCHHHVHHHHLHHQCAHETGPRPSATMSLSQAWFGVPQGGWGPQGCVRVGKGESGADRFAWVSSCLSSVELPSSPRLGCPPLVEESLTTSTAAQAAAGDENEGMRVRAGAWTEGACASRSLSMVQGTGEGSLRDPPGGAMVTALCVVVDSACAVGWTVGDAQRDESMRLEGRRNGMDSPRVAGTSCARSRGDDLAAASEPCAGAPGHDATAGLSNVEPPKGFSRRRLQKGASVDPSLEARASAGGVVGVTAGLGTDPCMCGKQQDKQNKQGGKGGRKVDAKKRMSDPWSPCPPERLPGWLPTLVLPAIFIVTGFLRVLCLKQQNFALVA